MTERAEVVQAVWPDDSPVVDDITREIIRDAPKAWGNKSEEWGPELGAEVPRVRDAARRIEDRLLELGWLPPGDIARGSDNA